MLDDEVGELSESTQQLEEKDANTSKKEQAKKPAKIKIKTNIRIEEPPPRAVEDYTKEEVAILRKTPVEIPEERYEELLGVLHFGTMW